MRSVIPVIAVVAVIVTIVAVGTVVLVIPTFGTVILLGLIDPIILLRFFLPGFYLFLDRLRLDLCLNRLGIDLGLDRGLRFFLDLGCLLDLCGLGLDFSRWLCLDRRLYGFNGLFGLCGLLLGSFLRFLSRGLFLRGLLLGLGGLFRLDVLGGDERLHNVVDLVFSCVLLENIAYLVGGKGALTLPLCIGRERLIKKLYQLRLIDTQILGNVLKFIFYLFTWQCKIPPNQINWAALKNALKSEYG